MQLVQEGKKMAKSTFSQKILGQEWMGMGLNNLLSLYLSDFPCQLMLTVM